MSNVVQTMIGVLPESDLDVKISKEDAGASWVMAQECTYVGADEALKEHVGKVIRRDVWVVIKHGLSATGEQGA